MPLPNGNTAWPPASPVYGDMREWSVWYSGDPDQLQGFYAPTSAALRATDRPAQYRGGLVGRLARWWWGIPTPQGEQPAKLHVPLAADICGTSADLLFSEAPKLTSESGDLQDFLDGLQEDGLTTRLHEGAEVCAALGGVYLRNQWDDTVKRLPWTEVVHADQAVPTFRAGRLQAVTFWQVLSGHDGQGIVWRLLERHEPGVIEYGLFKGRDDNLGVRVPLDEHPEAAYLAPMVTDASVIPTGITRLTAQYVPNVLPNRVHRGSKQGRSDLQGLPPFLDALDEAYSSWQRDIRHAKSRLHVPASMLDSTGPGQAAVTNIDREVYVPLEGILARSDSSIADMIQAQQFAIRVQEHMDTCSEWTKRIIESAGYSTQSLAGDTQGAATAAEVHSKERRSYSTRGKKIRYWTPAIREHLMAAAELANANLQAGLTLDDIGIEFEDGVQDTMLTTGQTAQTLRNARAASTETLVKLIHPEWSQDDVDAEVAAITAEDGGPVLGDPTATGQDPAAELDPAGGLPGDAGL